jgi:hypothetical protein
VGNKVQKAKKEEEADVGAQKVITAPGGGGGGVGC